MSHLVKRRPRKNDLPQHPTIPATPSVSPSISALTTTPSSTLSAFLKLTTHFRTNLPSHLIVAAIMLALGWNARSITISSFSSSNSALLIPLPDRVPNPPWWLENDYDDFVARTYITSGLHALRTPNTSSFFTGMCGRYRFNDTLYPDVSVIITVQNEQHGMLTLTVHSVIARTPPSLLRQIIIVDDNGRDSQSRAKVNETEFEELQALSPKIEIISNHVREGVARARMAGARQAHGDVLVFLDSHIEMLSGTWLQHLLIPVLEHGGTLAAQTLDIINDVDWTYGPGSGDILYGVISDEFWFGYQRSRFGGPNDDGREREAPGRRLPFESPFVAGSLFAVRRDWFEKIGGYDEGMYVWGGENTDFAIKTWACGGRVVMVPCSRVGHMYRQHVKQTGGTWPPKLPHELTDNLRLGGSTGWILRGSTADNFTKVTIRNNIRVMERWSKDYSARSGYYKKIFGSETLNGQWKKFAEEMKTDAYAIEQERFIQRNGCKRYEWFDRHVYYKLTGVLHPWHPGNPGRTWV